MLSEKHFAARCATLLWSAVLPTYRRQEDKRSFLHLRQAFMPSELKSLPLPTDGQQSPRQSVALVDGPDFKRSYLDADTRRAYEQRPRTKVYEGMDAASDGWQSLVAVQLARLTRCRVVCSLYVSNSGDRNLGAHTDAWLGIIVQLKGAKLWSLWPDDKDEPDRVLTEEGDVLILPSSVRHNVSTPVNSTHMVFALVTSDPIE